MRLANGRVPVLCCFEAVGGPKWCHRSLVASWLSAALGEAVPELGFEDRPQERHPLLPPKRGGLLAQRLTPSTQREREIWQRQATLKLDP